MIRPLPPPSWLKAKEIAARVASPVGRPFAAAKKGKISEIYLYDAIGHDPWSDTGIDPSDVVAAVAEAKGSDELAIHINSPGGFVFDGIAIFNAIRSFTGAKIVYVDGLAASIASIIAMAGDRVVMNEGSMFMIHDPWNALFAVGTADQIEDESRKTCNALRKIRETLLDVYVTATGRSMSEISAWMAAETWMTADEACERGFADEVQKMDPAEPMDPDEEHKKKHEESAAATPARILAPDVIVDLARAKARELFARFSPVPAAGAVVPCQPGKTSTAASRR